MATFADVILRVTGDTDAAERELEELTRELSTFGKVDPEVEIEILTAQAKAELLGLKAELATLGDQDIDFDIRRGVAERVMGMTTNISNLGAEIGGLGTDASGAGSGITRLGTSVGGLGASFASSGPAIAIGAAIMAGLATAAAAAAAALAALAASAAAALGFMGALAASALAAIAPVVALGVGAFQRFQDQAGQAGTAAHRLKEAISSIGDAFKHAIGRGADAIFRGLADALREMAPVIRKLQPAFTKLGRALGDVFRTLGEEFSSPKWTKFFNTMIKGAAKLAGPGTKVFIQFARILRDIAQAAMPFLIQMVKSLGKWLGNLRGKMGGVDGIRGAIEAMVPHFNTWLKLFGAIGSVVLEFFKLAAPAGKKIATWLAEGAKALAKWLRSPEGREKVKKFFNDVVPLIKEMGRAFLKASTTILEATQALTQPLTSLLKMFTSVLEVITEIINGVDWLLKHGGAGVLGEGAEKIRKSGAFGPFGFAEGVRNFQGGMAVVGERGPELVKLPGGADVFSNVESRRMVGASEFHFHTAPGHIADPRLAAAQAARRMRERGMSVS